MKKKGITIQCLRTNDKSCFELYRNKDELNVDLKNVIDVPGTKSESNDNEKIKTNEEIHINNNREVDKVTINIIDKRNNMVLPALAIAGIVVAVVTVVAVAAGVASVIYYQYIKVRAVTDKELKTYSDADTVTELERIIKSYQHTVHQLRAMQG